MTCVVGAMIAQRNFHYSRLLKTLLAERSRTNKLYSLRSFARKLRLSPSQLSRVMAGKRKVSTDSATLVARHLFQEENLERVFIELVVLGNRELEPGEERLEEFLFRQLHVNDVEHLSEERLRRLHRWSPSPRSQPG